MTGVQTCALPISELSGLENLINDPTENYSIGNFKDLICWQKCRELRIQLEKMTLSFPKDEKTRLADQIIRASRSTTNNIAEGFGRFHYKDSIRFYYISRGSLSELLDHLTIAYDNGIIEKSTLLELENLSHEAARILNGYINFINSKITKP